MDSRQTRRGIKGSRNRIRSISTTIQKNYFDTYANGGVFYVGGWANTYSSPLVGNTNYVNDKVFRISVTFLGIGGNTIKTEYVNFNQSIYEWQYVYGEIIAPEIYASVKISFDYQGLGEVIFDGATVFFEASDKAYDYDEFGRLIEISWDDGKKLVYLYTNDESYYPYQIKDENNNIIMVLDSDGTKIESMEKYNVKSTPTYNTNGQVTGMTITGYGSYYEQQNDFETTYFTTSTTYLWNNQYLATTVDEFGNTTEYRDKRVDRSARTYRECERCQNPI
ncbi:MAG: hypothetical protein MZU97_17275 [Bacillus subtilis]|nr:hypothetical protein [Bacillus subtilis]